MHILMLTGDAGESQEIYYPKFRLEEEGWSVRIASPTKKALISVVHDFEPGFETFTEKPGYRVESDLSFDQVVPAQFQALVLPGGRAPEFLRTKPRAVEIVKHFLETGKPESGEVPFQPVLIGQPSTATVVYLPSNPRMVGVTVAPRRPPPSSTDEFMACSILIGFRCAFSLIVCASISSWGREINAW